MKSNDLSFIQFGFVCETLIFIKAKIRNPELNGKTANTQSVQKTAGARLPPAKEG
jgi:hypothetical protein